MSRKKYNENDYVAFNSYGGFNAKRDEYHILNTNTPLPWCNIMANEKFGTIISSYGTVYTYYKNSREFKISNWCNDWVTFSPGEKFKGIFEQDYNLVYGFGYTSVLEEENEINKKMDIFIPTEENVKIHYITLENENLEEEKSIEIEYSIEPVLGVARETTEDYILSRINNNLLEMKNPYSVEFSNITCFIDIIRCKENINYSYDEKNYSVKVIEYIKNNKIWVCDICGFVFIGDVPPKVCPICKVPGFKILEVV